MKDGMILRFETFQQIDALVIQPLGNFPGNEFRVSGS
jgi:hypothetical protein